MITPGPWNVSRHASPEHSPQFGVYAEGQRNDHIIVTGDNAASDARTIAALPDLIDALKMAEGALSAWLDQGNKNIAPMVEHIRATLQKAKGL